MVEEPLSTTTTEPPEFVATMAEVGRCHPWMRRWFLKRYYENPAGFEVTADESRWGRNPPGLLYSKLRAGMHLDAAAAPAPNGNGKRVTGWRRTRGTHGTGYVRDPHGTDPPPRYTA